MALAAHQVRPSADRAFLLQRKRHYRYGRTKPWPDAVRLLPRGRTKKGVLIRHTQAKIFSKLSVVVPGKSAKPENGGETKKSRYWYSSLWPPR